MTADAVIQAPSTVAPSAISEGAKLAIMVLGVMPQAQAEEIATLGGIFIGKILSQCIEDAFDRRFGNSAEVSKPNETLQKDDWPSPADRS